MIPKTTENVSKGDGEDIVPIAPSLGIHYAAPPHLEYSYPPINETIVKNITNAIIAVPKLYTQVLHLMNKMNLPPPFGVSRSTPSFPVSSIGSSKRPRDELKYYADSGSESELESEKEEGEDDGDEKGEKKSAKRQAKTESHVNIKEKRQKGVNSMIFKPESKVLSIRMKDDQSTSSTTVATAVGTINMSEENQQLISSSLSNSGEIRPLNDMQPPPPSSVSSLNSLFTTPLSDRQCLSLEFITHSRISKEEMQTNKAFENYSFGNPSNKLFIRNLPKTVTEDELFMLFGCFFDSDDEAKEKLSVRVMEGRMKGQAFVTFPDAIQAGKALLATNGFLMKDKAIVVCYGKSTA